MARARTRSDAGPGTGVRPVFRHSDDSAATIVRSLRHTGPTPRSALVRRTGLSASTVSRVTAALLDAGVIVEIPDLVESYGGGRPGRPIALSPTGPIVVACHIGRRRSVVAVADAGHRVLAHETLPTPEAPPETLVDVLAARAASLADRFPVRPLLRSGIAGAFRVADDGTVDHDLLGWRDEPLAVRWRLRIPAPVTISSHVEAIAAAESLVQTEAHEGTTLLVYCRESVGCAQVADRAVLLPRSGPGDLSGLRLEPTEHLGGGGADLASTVADSSLLDVARKLGIDEPDVASLAERAALGDSLADALLAERGRVLGRAVGTVVCIIRPDRVILAGQGFAAFPRYLQDVARGFEDVDLRGDRPRLHVSRAGERVQLHAAITTAMDPFDRDPLGEAGASRPSESGCGVRRPDPGVDPERAVDTRGDREVGDRRRDVHRRTRVGDVDHAGEPALDRRRAQQQVRLLG